MPQTSQFDTQAYGSTYLNVGGAVVYWLVYRTVRALACALHCVLGQYTFVVPLSTQVYKWVVCK